MKFEIRARGLSLSRALKEHAERHFRFALDRFGERVRRVHVVVEDVNGPRGGEDIHCKVTADLTTPGGLILREVSTNPFAAVARAADRLAHGVGRRVERLTRRRPRRGPRRGPHDAA